VILSLSLGGLGPSNFLAEKKKDYSQSDSLLGALENKRLSELGKETEAGGMR
jgi:hypothetical protein